MIYRHRNLIINLTHVSRIIVKENTVIFFYPKVVPGFLGLFSDDNEKELKLYYNTNDDASNAFNQISTTYSQMQ
jgi:hypothetical protein